MSGRSIQWGGRPLSLSRPLIWLRIDAITARWGPGAKDELDKRLSGHSRPARGAPGQLSGFLSMLANMLLICAIDALYLTLRERIGYT